MIDIAILNAYLIGRQLYSNSYLQYKEFRVNLWSTLFSYLVQVSSDWKLAKFYPPTTTPTLYIFQTKSPIDIESPPPIKQAGQVEEAEILEHKWKALGKWVYCYNCRAIYLAIEKRKFGDEIPINGVQRKRAR